MTNIQWRRRAVKLHHGAPPPLDLSRESGHPAVVRDHARTTAG